MRTVIPRKKFHVDYGQTRIAGKRKRDGDVSSQTKKQNTAIDPFHIGVSRRRPRTSRTARGSKENQESTVVHTDISIPEAKQSPVKESGVAEVKPMPPKDSGIAEVKEPSLQRRKRE